MNKETKRSKNIRMVIATLEANVKVFLALKNSCEKDDEDLWYYSKSYDDVQEEIFNLKQELLTERCKTCEMDFNDELEQCQYCMEIN